MPTDVANSSVSVIVTAVGEIVFITNFPEKSEREMWCGWLRQHSIDPGEVPAPSYIEVDRVARRIKYLAFDLDDNGHRFPLPDYKHASASVREVQLEAPILDLPVTNCTGCRLSGEKFSRDDYRNCLQSGTDQGVWHGVA